MDSRSIAATAINGGRLTAATEIDVTYTKPKYYFNKSIYENRVFDGRGKADSNTELKFGPNIKDWPSIPSLTEDLLLKVVTYIDDPVTTTDEIIPSGETSSFRSNPLRLAEFTFGRKDPAYVGKTKEIHKCEIERESGKDPSIQSEEIKKVYDKIRTIKGFENIDPKKVGIGSTIFANKPGDGSAREQAASCQRVIGAWANLAKEYATKRYRSNLINWGMGPFLIKGEPIFNKDEFVFIPNLRSAILEGKAEMKAYAIGNMITEFTVSIGDLTEDEKSIIIAGCLINYYKTQSQ
jgi:aconitate hydratase